MKSIEKGKRDSYGRDYAYSFKSLLAQWRCCVCGLSFWREKCSTTVMWIVQVEYEREFMCISISIFTAHIIRDMIGMLLAVDYL